MSTRTVLTQTQQKLLDAANAHPQGRLIFPDTLRGGARLKVINALAAEYLIDASVKGVAGQGRRGNGGMGPGRGQHSGEVIPHGLPRYLAHQ
jgi:hypothetical protein